jgi:hypothetical protein
VCGFKKLDKRLNKKDEVKEVAAVSAVHSITPALEPAGLAFP